MKYRLSMMVSIREILDKAGFDIKKCMDFDRRLFRMDVN